MERFQCRRVCACGLAMLSIGSLTASPARADITLDGSLGPSGPLIGPNFEIPAGVGEQVGPNLFHSFGDFSIDTGESATFIGPSGINNVLGRVTGGESSTIDGLLRSEITGADLYLINPAGVMFGPNAQLDVQGSFHTSTADYLRLGDEGRFAATQPATSTLIVAPPSAFGFLDRAPAPINMLRSELAVPRSETLSIVGGNIKIAGGSMSAPGGRINIANVAAPGEIGIGRGGLNIERFARLGDIVISQGATIDATGEGGGSISIKGRQLVLDNALIDATTAGSIDGAGIIIELTGDLVLSDAAIGTPTSGGGDAGDIVIEAGRVSISGRTSDGAPSGLYSATLGVGNAGAIVVAARTLIVTGGLMTASALEGSQGSAGKVTLKAKTTRLSGGLPGGEVDDLVPVVDTRTSGAGPAGDVQIVADKVIVDTGAALAADSEGSGHGGDISIEVGHITLSGGAQISSGANASGPGGNVNLAATDGILVVRGRLVDFPSALLSTADGSGRGGNITVSTDGALVMKGGSIATRTLGDADAGAVAVRARNCDSDQWWPNPKRGRHHKA